MTRGTIWRHLLAFCIPMAIGLLFQQLYNTVDTIVVGKFVGKEALAAVGSVGSIVNMLVGICTGLSTGAGVVISQHYGAHDDEKLSDSVQTTILMTFIISVIATVIGLFIVDPMLYLMDTPEDVFDQARSYLTIYFAGLSGLLIYNMGSGILRAVGDSQRPLYFLIFSAVTNIVLDIVFVVAFRMGVAGVAIATIISQFLSAALVMFTLTRTEAAYRIRWKLLKIHPEPLKKIISIGMPSGIQQALTSFSNVFVQSYINYFGSSCMAGWSCHSKIDVYILIPVQSIALASSTFVAQNYGAKNLDRARKGVRQALFSSVIITLVLSIIVILFAHPLLFLFSDEAEVIEYGSLFIRVVTPFYFTVCFNQIFAGALRGIGKAKIPMYIMLGSYVVFRHIYLFIARSLGGGVIATGLGFPFGWMMCSLLMMIFYMRSPLGKKNSEEIV